MMKKTKKVKVKKAHKKPKGEITVKKNTIWKAGVAVLGIIILILIFNVKSNAPTQEIKITADNPVDKLSGTSAETPAGQTSSVADNDKVDVDFYVMSQCPFGTQVEDAFAPVIEKMGDAINFKVDFIASGEPGSFSSLHGQKEVQGDIVQLCAMEHSSDYAWVDMITCMNKDARSIPDNWEKCAKEANLDVDAIKTCYEGDEGANLLSASLKRSQDIGARGSPTIYVAGTSYSGGRQTADFMRSVCNEVDHEACADIPKPVSVDVIVLNDEKCTSCDTSQIMAVNKQYFPGMKVKNVDVSSDEGKSLIKLFGLTYVPAYIFSGSIVDTASWKDTPQLSNFFEQSGDYYRLKDSATGASWFVDEDKRKAFYSDIGVELGDNRPQVDFFVMSYCPYGNQAEELLAPVFDALGDDADFNPRYVIYENYQGGGPKYCLDNDSMYCSMHGIAEVHQDIRETCVNQMYGTQAWFDFALAMNSDCTAGNADTCWKGVAEKLGYDTDAISACESEQGIAIVKENKELGEKLAVSGSPTLFFDGEKYAGARSADGYKAALCAKFSDAPEICGDVITAEATPVASGSCG